MSTHGRTFEAKAAVREAVPVLLGLMGPSGGGKTVSALRVATGMQQITGGDIYGIDTEARRMLHHADAFKFKHVQFDAPFGSLDYLAAIRQCVAAGAKIVIVDSMSHEHESSGGMIDFHDKELDRLAGNDWAKRERVKMLAWQKPKAARRELINGLLQMNANFIFCFRAKNTVKPVKINGKTEIVPQGFMPIAGEEFVFEMTANCLLMPGAKGVPTWQSENVGERTMIKSARQFDSIFADGRALDEGIGRALAEWARGGSAPQSPRVSTVLSPGDAVDPPAPASTPPDHPMAGAGDGSEELMTERLERIDADLTHAASKGTPALREAWDELSKDDKATMRSAMDRRHKPTAREADKKLEGAQS